MARTIKFAEGFKLVFDGMVTEFRDGDDRTVGEKWSECMDTINIPCDLNLRADLFAHLFAFGYLNLSDAYCKKDKRGRVTEGHTVEITFIPVGE